LIAHCPFSHRDSGDSAAEHGPGIAVGVERQCSALALDRIYFGAVIRFSRNTKRIQTKLSICQLLWKLYSSPSPILSAAKDYC
jgi:hypothetical protein